MHVRLILSVLLMVFVAVMSVRTTDAQQTEGDQFLDGIGETALVARYVLAENTKDSSRNQYHASTHGAEPKFVEDKQFGRVLSLAGGQGGGFLQLPSESLIGLDSISVTGWVQLRSETPWQRFFDFGTDSNANFFCTPIGGDENEGFRARITDSGWSDELGPVAARVAINRWVHLTVVLNAADKTLTSYVDAKEAAKTTGIGVSLEDILDQEGDNNRLFLGKSQYESDETLNAKLHDVRVYSIALSAKQVATIYSNVRNGEVAATEPLPVATNQNPQSPNEPATSLNIDSVEDVAVTTPIGHLPSLPLWVKGISKGREGSELVRVIWPAPEDNEQVLKTGSYTVTGTIPGSAVKAMAKVTVVGDFQESQDLPHRTLESFPLGQVTLNPDTQGRETLLMLNRDKFVDGLLRTDPDSFLYMFRDAFGQPQPEGARPLRGWDSQTTRLRGHASGHYLTAIAQAYASATYDEQVQGDLKRKMDYLITTLHELSSMSGRPAVEGGASNADPANVPTGPDKQQYDSDLSEEGIRNDYWNWGHGFISAYPPDQFIMLEKGATYGGRNHQIWAPYYTLHKILAGLLDCYEVGGNEKALQVARDMGLWVFQRLRKVPLETRIEMWNRYIAGEYGGMNEVMARLYRVTEDERFLECAKLFDNTEFFFGDAQRSHGLARNVDTIRGKHANQHIPQIIGALETYRTTQQADYYRVASNFWNLCTGSYMYAIGGVAGASTPNNAECFTAEPDSLFRNGFARGGQNETCATYNLLKLSRQLFLYQPEAKYMDHYEQALYNHILASVAKDNAGNTYHVPLNPGSRKGFGNARMNGFTCCNGTALESSTKLQNTLYFKSADNQSLYVNLFVPSTLNWEARKVVVTQETSYPYANTSKLTLEGAGKFDVFVRIPGWAGEGPEVSINGESVDHQPTAGEYLRLTRDWAPGDTIEVTLPMEFRLNRVMDQPNIASVFYGPVLLAVQESGRLADWRQVSLDPADLEQAISGDPSKLEFQIGDLQLKPFFASYDRYSVYFDVMSGAK